MVGIGLRSSGRCGWVRVINQAGRLFDNWSSRIAGAQQADEEKVDLCRVSVPCRMTFSEPASDVIDIII